MVKYKASYLPVLDGRIIDLMWVYLNGNILKSEEARISPLDRSFTFGDGVYEVIPSYNNNLFLFKKHLDRLYSSLEKTFIKAPSDLIDLKKILRELHEKNKHKNQFFYVQISRGIQAVSYTHLTLPTSSRV